ncbi:unnamed protein product [Menidia menidia]|uniref:(Atlantic silverside) hypothetical protein n=1 Tax=Menidia menidia TaxID=238744 RepID=A0A8S4API6_9TELE|nr:unnamed protein product [Menidia menidia]
MSPPPHGPEVSRGHSEVDRGGGVYLMDVSPQPVSSSPPSQPAALPPPPPTRSPCPSGYTSWYSSCYRLVEEAASWEKARAACRDQGGDLASIDMSYDQAFVAGAVLQGRADAWIGLRREEDGSYGWSDGWPVFFTQWGPGEPSTVAGEGCVSMHAAARFHGTWNDTGCEQAKAYICKITSDKPPPTPSPGDGKCLPFWVPYGRHCYAVYDGQQGYSWPDARHFCQSLRTDLASVHSRAEQEFLRTLNYTANHHVWIGLTRDRNCECAPDPRRVKGHRHLTH